MDRINALEFDGISHSYGKVKAVRDLSISVKPGSVVCLLGPSGCGKTTALRIAAGLEVPNNGKVSLSGRLVAGAGVFDPPESRNIGLVFQDYALFPHLNIRENVAFGVRELGNTEQARLVQDMLGEVGMEAHLNAYPHMLSGGQQQRVALARALARNPNLILMDEPFSGLDARLRDKVRDRTLHVLKNLQAAALMVTHDSEEAMYMADQIAVMLDGTVIQIGTPDELYYAPKTAFVAEFFGEVNRIHATVKNGQAETGLGLVPAAGFADGTRVDVIVRPEALSLVKCPQDRTGAGYARVLTSRLLGRTSLIHLCARCGNFDEIHLHARIAGKFNGIEGELYKLSLDFAQTFVFASCGESGRVQVR